MATLQETGYLGRDTELRYVGANNTPVCAFSVACPYGRRDPNTGKQPVEWVEGVIWGALAESLSPYLLKGQQINFTLDDVHIEEFERTDRSRGHKLTGRAISIKLCGSSPDRQAAQGSHNRQPQQRPPQQQRQPQQQPQPTPDYSSFDDDIPFMRMHYLEGA